MILQAFTLAVCFLCAPASKEYAIPGTDVRFVVDQEQLAATPTWNPEDTDEPTSARTALRVAKEFHQSLQFKGFYQFFTWSLAGATLVKADANHWYWVVQYRGDWDVEANLKPGEGVNMSYSGPRTVFLRYPVLMNGKLLRQIPLEQIPDAFKLLK